MWPARPGGGGGAASACCAGAPGQLGGSWNRPRPTDSASGGGGQGFKMEKAAGKAEIGKAERRNRTADCGPLTTRLRAPDHSEAMPEIRSGIGL